MFQVSSKERHLEKEVSPSVETKKLVVTLELKASVGYQRWRKQCQGKEAKGGGFAMIQLSAMNYHVQRVTLGFRREAKHGKERSRD